MTRTLLLLVTAACLCAGRPVLVLSVDGLDHRYLRDADKFGLKIPNLRRLMREGAWANGVVGVVPTVTWPSHTTLISGVTPAEHGILNNRRPKSEGGEYYWTADLLKKPTLLDAMKKAGRPTAAVTWPVTVDAPLTYNLPEYFMRRNGGAMDLASISKKSTPGLIDEIAKQYPSFPKQWVDDRARAQATMYLLRTKKPDLVLVHLVDLDSEAHETGPFSRESNAILEYTDELIGQILAVMPKEYALALVSDHAFERTDRIVHIKAQAGDGVVITPFLLVAQTPAAASRIRELRAKTELGIGREVPLDELRKLAPFYENAAGAWESAEHFSFSAEPSKGGTMYTVPHEKGNHGLWPTRPDYRSIFVLWGPGIRAERLPEIQMTSIAAKLAATLGLQWPQGNH